MTITPAPTWAHHRALQPGAEPAWVAVDAALRGIARRRAALDAEEARWLREAEALQIWRPLGMVNALDYMERVLGYAPRAAQERLRVARALGELPVLTTALANGGLAFSAVRELTRVATPATEADWAAAGAGKNLRQIEELVAGHRPGDLPDDPADPEVRTRVVRFELSAETFATLRQAREILDDEHGANLDDDGFVAMLAAAVLDGGPGRSARSVEVGAGAEAGADADAEVEADTDADTDDELTRSPIAVDGHRTPSGRARFQIAVTVCARCTQGWQQGAGALIPIGPAAVERATCDAQHLGLLDAEVPTRAHQDVTPAVARLVWRRDRGRCQTPGCRSSRGLEIHHVVPRADGGGHATSNLRLHCAACHHAQHAGTLALGAAPADAAHRPLERAVLRAQARDALVGLGWKPGVAREAVDTALAALGAGATLEQIIRAALPRCPVPTLREA